MVEHRTLAADVRGSNPLSPDSWGCSSAIEPPPLARNVRGLNPLSPSKLFSSSSAVEQVTVNHPVVGSIPALRAMPSPRGTSLSEVLGGFFVWY